MKTRFQARFTLRLAWRNLRYSPKRTGFVVAALALAIATVSGVHGACELGRRSLRGDARAWLAGDLAIDTREPLTRDQAESLERARPGGTAWTLMTTSLTMARSDQSPDAGMIQVKAVDPARYPFYGTITLNPARPLAQALSGDRIAVSDEVLDRLGVAPGDSITIAGKPFTISARITGEPDRFSNEVGIGMRCLMSRADYDRAGLDQSAASARNRVLLRLPANANPSSARSFLTGLFPGGSFRDAQAAHRHETEITENIIAFLSITAFLSVALGSLGAAIAVRQHTEARLPILAIMKTLGARSSQLAATLIAEIGVTVIAALALGIALGLVLERALLLVGRRYIALPPVSGENFVTLAATACVSLFAILPILVQPLVWLRYLRPAIVLRREAWAAESVSRLPVSARIFSIAAAVASLAALLGIAIWMLNSWVSALLLFAVISATLLVTLLLASAALSILRRTFDSHKPAHAALRYGIASVYRPANRARTLVVAFAASLILMIATFESRGAVIASVFDLLPADRANLYLVGFRSADRAPIEAFVRSLPGVAQMDVVSQIRVDLRAKNGDFAGETAPVQNRAILRQIHANFAQNPRQNTAAEAAQTPVGRDGICDQGRVLDSTDGVTEVCIDPSAAAEEASKPLKNSDLREQLLQLSDRVNTRTGDGWNYYFSQITQIKRPAGVFPAANRLQPMTVDDYLSRLADVLTGGGFSAQAMCDAQLETAGDAVNIRLSQDLANELAARPGSRLEMDVRDRSYAVRVAQVGDLAPWLKIWFSMSMDCSRISPDLLYHQASIQVSPDKLGVVVSAIRERFPSLAVITAKEISQTVDALTADALSLARRVAWCTITGGLLVLIAVVAASRGGRMQEVALLATLGASRAVIFRIYCVEFAVIGAISAGIASLLAWGLSSAALAVIFHHFEARIPWLGMSGAIVGGALAAIAGGWLPTFSLLSRKPLEILRSE